MIERTSDLGDWSVQAIRDFDEPGWFHIPSQMTGVEREAWVEMAMAQVKRYVGVPRWDGSPTTEAMLREILEYGVEDEPALPSIATFQVWPLPGPAVLTCRVCLMDSSSVPDFTSVEGAVVHPVESPELGAGVQVTIKRTVEESAGWTSLFGVDLIFMDGDAALVLSLEQSLPALISGALPGLGVLKDSFRIIRPDGQKFGGITPENVLNEKPWELANDGR
ncbi:hypothetical protein WBG06_09630 [Nocardioides sp. CCNWLW239]|uniref:hypothetical protein n=1 Tax=Nocardioides sp. CCNWLW239 TaxID=3128902 RepID=UPI00301A4EC0